jgi:galactokinase/mevalonate kinase-like predicted kinase
VLYFYKFVENPTRMKTLLTLPNALIKYFNQLFPKDTYYADSDPIEGKVGSGGGTANLLVNCFKKERTADTNFETWLGKEKRILIHAGGQSRRLPAYAPVGKVLTPIPVFRWERGQKIDQTLLDLQMPLFEEILNKSPKSLNTLIASGDVLIRAGEQISPLPEADVVCYGQWIQPEQAQQHGVFFCKRSNPQQLEFMLQKPSSEKIQDLAADYLFLLDIGIWVLSEKAVKVLCKKSGWDASKQQFTNGNPDYYDLYSTFGTSLGNNAIVSNPPEGDVTNEGDVTHEGDVGRPLHFQQNSTEIDPEINALTVTIVPMPKGTFYHFGSNNDLIESATRLQNMVTDQREIWHRKVKPHPDIFTQNAITKIGFTYENSSVWIENSYIGKDWTIHNRHILTGIPENDWKIDLPAGVCLDIIPIAANTFCIRPYGFQDEFKGAIGDPTTKWLGKPITENSYIRELINNHHVDANTDIQFARIFPVIVPLLTNYESFIQTLLNGETPSAEFLPLPRLSAAEIQEKINFERLNNQRDVFKHDNLKAISRNYKNSIFYQLDLNDTARHFAFAQLDLPPALPTNAPLFTRMHDQMFRARVTELVEANAHNNTALSGNDKNVRTLLSGYDNIDTAFSGNDENVRTSLSGNDDNVGTAFSGNDENVGAALVAAHGKHEKIIITHGRPLHFPNDLKDQYESKAFSLLSETIVSETKAIKVHPELNVMSDQIIWGRSPIRLDLAGGWSDTPPYCLFHGGKVINMAIELNGQPPLQVFIKPSEDFKITLRSIDLGVREDVDSFEQLIATNNVGSAFSIPKAALCLAGFHPDFASHKYSSLKDQLKDFGAGIEISLLAAIPKGSGLGTSSILASTVLGALAEFCTLGWDKHEICFRTLVLEQLLTTGGGWQDQYGGVFNGIKLLESEAGLIQKPVIRWAPDHLFTQQENASSILLYYTGITRVAKNILAEIVRGMFLNSSSHLAIIKEIKYHALTTYDAVQQGNWDQLAAAINQSWVLNQRLDLGTNPLETQALLKPIEDYLSGLKLLGAGGGGYLLLFAKDIEAAGRIRHQLTTSPPNPRARFVDWSISKTGFQVTRS